MISADGVSFAYGDHRVLDAVTLHAVSGQVLGLVGPNGSGKTTLLRTLYHSLSPQTGTVLLDGTDLGRLRTRDVAREVSVVVQESPSDLPLLVSDMVLLGRVPHRSSFAADREADHQIAAAALDRVGALDLADHPFEGLSGGERQRVLIARALAQQASHLLLDEPTNHLDVRYQHEVLDLVRDLATTGGHTVVVVLHDLNLAATYCDRVVLLDQGRVVTSGPAAEVLGPEFLAPVYGVDVQRIAVGDGFQLIFRPRRRHDGDAAPATTPRERIQA